MTSTETIDLTGRWRLHPRVSLRPEPFGALAYHYDNRRLNFLRSPDLVELVKSLAEFEAPRLAFDAAGLAESRWPSFEKALVALAQSDFLQAVEATSTSGPPHSESTTRSESTHSESTHSESTHSESTHSESTHSESTHSESTHSE